MTIIDARSLSTADLRHLGANLAAVVQRDRHDARALSARPTGADRARAHPVSLIPNKKEPLRC